MKTEYPPAPAHLSPNRHEWWDALVRAYELDAHHLDLLQQAAECWDRKELARKVLDSDGLTFNDRFGQPKPRPEVAVERDSRLAFARMLRELALDVVQPGDEKRAPNISGNAALRVS